MNIKTLENQYIKYMEYKIKKQDEYLENTIIFNKNTQERFTMSYTNEDFYNKLSNDNIYYKLSSEYLNDEMIKDGYIPIFLTNTLPTQYHQYKKDKNGKLIKNKKYKNYSINDGYQLLKDSHRNIYKNFRINRKYIKVKFNIVYEPHKTFTPHSHSIYYIKNEESIIKLFKTHIKEQTKLLGKQQDIVVLDNQNKTISYLLKYVSKSLGEYNKVISGWKLKNKIRMFNLSKSSNKPPRYIYDRFTKNTPLFFSENGELNENIFNTINKYVSYTTETYNKEKDEIKIKSHTSQVEEKYKIFVKRIVKKEDTQKTRRKRIINNMMIKDQNILGYFESITKQEIQEVKNIKEEIKIYKLFLRDERFEFLNIRQIKLLSSIENSYNDMKNLYKIIEEDYETNNQYKITDFIIKELNKEKEFITSYDKKDFIVI